MKDLRMIPCRKNRETRMEIERIITFLFKNCCFRLISIFMEQFKSVCFYLIFCKAAQA